MERVEYSFESPNHCCGDEPEEERERWGVFPTKRQAYLFATLCLFNDNPSLFAGEEDEDEDGELPHIAKVTDIPKLDDMDLMSCVDWDERIRESLEEGSIDCYRTWTVERQSNSVSDVRELEKMLKGERKPAPFA